MKKSRGKAKAKNRKTQQVPSGSNTVNNIPDASENKTEETGTSLTDEKLMKKRDTGEEPETITDSGKKDTVKRKAPADESKTLADLLAQEKNKNETAATDEVVFDDMEKGTRKRFKILPIVLGSTVAIALLVFGIVYLYQKGYYNDRWYQNTEINGVDVSGQSVEESSKILLEKMGDYALTVKGRDNGSTTFRGEDIDFNFSFTDDYRKLFNKQHESFSLFPKRKTYTAKFDISFDEKKLRKLVKSSEFITGSDAYPVVKPKSATVKYSEEKQQYECIKEVQGNKLSKKKFLEVVENAIRDGVTNIDLTDANAYPDIYATPKVTADDPKLQKKMKVLNYAILRYVVWNMGKGVTEQITPTELSQWANYKDGKVTFDDTAVSNWVETFCKKYKTTDKERKVKMHNKKYVTVKAGDYGWQLDYEKVLEQAKNGLAKKIKKSDIQAYLAEPSEEHKKALTFKKKVPYANTAFKKDYDNFAEDWDPENYTEVSLKEQMVYVIRKGKVAFSCQCITGRDTPERSTKPGAYFVKEHQPHRVLVGDDYRTPVSNWVRITWTGTGFHAAGWQRWGSWSPSYHITRGSHGCVNLTVSDSAKIYSMVKYREAVFIY